MRIVGDQVATKAVGDTRDTTDLSKADDPEGTPVLLRADQTLNAEVFVASTLVGARHMPNEREGQVEDEFSRPPL